MSGIKHDQEKPPMELLSPVALEAIARVFGAGKVKYGKWNYREGMEWSRIIGAAYRHLTAFNRGEDYDPETKIAHLAHLACCAIMLMDYMYYELGTDDRWRKPDPQPDQSGE